MTLARQVRQRFQSTPPGGIVASRTLHGLSADSQQVDKAASRLYKSEGLQRLRNGMYFKPYNSQFFGPLPPGEGEVIRALKKQYQASIGPTGELAAYELGFTPDIPETITYETDKRISPVQLDNHRLSFRKVDGKKLNAVNSTLLSILKALEFLYREHGSLSPQQQYRARRLLSRHSTAHLSKAIALWPRWFQEAIQPLLATDVSPYITGLSALNIPYRGKQADWHQIGMLDRQKFLIAGRNYDSAPALKQEELFDCSDFLDRHNLQLNTQWCATPLRAMKDILYTHIIKKNQYPDFFRLDELMLDVSRDEIRAAVESLHSFANEKQVEILTQWMQDNELI
ncbi:MAG: DUF6088 family protein [Pseudomonadales bacterium]